MSTRHKWYKEIQAWSEGAEIEYAVANSLNYEWHPLDSVNRFEHRNTNFRIKPQPKEPSYMYVYADGDFFIHSQSPIGAPAHWQYFGKIEVQDE